MPDRVELAAPWLAALGARTLGVLPGYVPPPPLGSEEITGLPAVLEFWRGVLARYPDSEIENLAIVEAAPGRFVRTARLRHSGPEAQGPLEYEIVQTTYLRKGRVVRQVNELAR